jgi:hypothetical protein
MCRRLMLLLTATLLRRITKNRNSPASSLCYGPTNPSFHSNKTEDKLEENKLFLKVILAHLVILVIFKLFVRLAESK